jgi:3-hydroxybutyryl-CoA dehydrogenase
MSSAPQRVVVFGGGRMGAGIAHAFVTAGSDVVVLESDPAAVDQARTRIERDLRRSQDVAVAGPDAGEGQAPRTGNLTVTTDLDGLAAADLVVEAVPEILETKRVVLALAQRHAPRAVIASNTSSLSIDGLASWLLRPDRFLGLHFFNPVPVSDLVEIVVGGQTAPDVVAIAHDWVRTLGKTAITVQDSPGFASSRLGVCQALEAIRMLQDGVASAADIDAAMTLGYRHAAGPLRTTDLVGLDVRLAIAQHLERELGSRFAPPQLLVEKVAAGELGRKSGRGFFDW